MPKVNYNGKTVSDANIKTVLQRIADQLSKNVEITSGDRTCVYKGGSKTSHHIKKRAADFYIPGYTMQQTFDKIKNKKSDIFDSDKNYQVIHHGPCTATGGQHIHVGRYASGSGVSFLVEGLTAAGKGKYKAG